MRSVTILLAAVVMLVATAQAEVVLHEGFNYSGGALANQSGGGEFGFNGAWDAGSIALSTDGSLSYSGINFEAAAGPFTPVGNRVYNTTGAYNYRPTDANVRDLTDFGESNTFYVSGLIRMDSGGGSGDNIRILFFLDSDQWDYFGMTLRGDGGGYIYMPGQSNWLDAELDETYFFVMKVVTSATENDVGHVSLYGQGDTVTEDEPTSWDATETRTGTNGKVISMFVGDNDSGGGYGHLDEIRIGGTWSDVTVVPEPATMVLLGIGGIGVLIRRKRR